jgi:putative tryptophan/tyrosine transport system substrate-binding protein
MRRRKFITLLGGAAVWPVAAQAQPSLIPVIGLVNVGTPIDSLTEAFRQGLAELGYIEGRNVVIDYRNADNRYERLPGLVTELVRRPVTLIVAITTPPALAAKAAGVPLVFMVADDPVKLGLVTSFNRPGGTSTGIDFLFSDLGPKQLSLLREVVPRAARIGLLINPHNSNAEAVSAELVAAGAEIGVEVVAAEASDSQQIEAAFALLVGNHVEALIVGTDPFFFRRRVQITTLTTRHALPAIFNAREYADAGGLMSYGTSLSEAFRQTGVYAGRVLRGEKPADLPVVQPTKFLFVVNQPTARALGIELQASLLAQADEVIE